MPLGDSITEAYTGYASYRYSLWRDLQDAGYQVDLVGSMSGVYGGPPLYTDFDQDHEGHGGWRADEVLASISGWANAVRPHIVLLHLGHNDLWQGQTIASTINELAAIITVLRSVNPKVKTLLAQLIPATPAALSNIPTLNAQIASLAASLSTLASPVILVDQFTGFDAAVDTWDGVHPNASGEQKIAARWFNALAGFLGRPADINQDSRIDALDLGILMGGWATTNSSADLNGDNTVDSGDLLLLLDDWSP